MREFITPIVKVLITGGLSDAFRLEKQAKKKPSTLFLNMNNGKKQSSKKERRDGELNTTKYFVYSNF